MIEHLGTYTSPPSVRDDQKRRIFQGAFFDGPRKEGPHTVLLDYSRAHPQRVVGYVVGGNRAAVSLRFPHNLAELRSESDDPDAPRVTCGTVRILSAYRSSFREDEDGATGVAGVFEAERIEVYEPRTHDGPRSVRFTITGSHNTWGAIRAFMKPGKFDNAVIAGLPTDLVVEIAPYEITWSDPPRRVSQEVCSLLLSERSCVASISDDELLSHATALATDLVTLGSLLADEPMVWFQRHAGISTGFTTTYQVPPVLPQDRHPVEPRPYFAEPQALLRTAVPALRQWRARGLNLDRTIGFLTDARHASQATLPQRFASAFLALEMLTSFDALDSNTEFALGGDQFGTLVVPAVKTAIRQVLPDDARARDLLYQKLRDLNRTAFSTRLTALLRRHDVRWDDLYPDGHDLVKPAFIDLRDRLFHAGDGPSDERLEFEILRIRVVVIRLLFRMLGWSGDVPYPPDAGQSWLRRYWGEELP